MICESRGVSLRSAMQTFKRAVFCIQTSSFWPVLKTAIIATAIIVIQHVIVGTRPSGSGTSSAYPHGRELVFRPHLFWPFSKLILFSCNCYSRNSTCHSLLAHASGSGTSSAHSHRHGPFVFYPNKLSLLTHTTGS